VNHKLSGVILAAGHGTRIKPLNLFHPKPLLPVCNKPIMQYQIEAMRAIGVTDVVIVVGHLKDEITRYFGDGSSLGVNITYVEQKQMLGIAHAVAQLESVIDSPFVLFLGDIFSVQKDLPGMAEMFWARKAGAVLAVKHEPNPEFIRRNFAVILHASGTVTRVIEKPRYLTNNLKGCGVYMFDLAIFDAIRRTPRTAQRDEYEITSSIQILIDDGYPVYPIETIEWDMNVTFASDLLECNHRQLDHLALDRLIGENVQMPEKTVVERSVIGNNVVIRHPIAVRRSLILSDVVVDSTDDLDHMLITPDTAVRCDPETAGRTE
jgi:glucose-1-phosphate thymidylyltransferase